MSRRTNTEEVTRIGKAKEKEEKEEVVPTQLTNGRLPKPLVPFTFAVPALVTTASFATTPPTELRRQREQAEKGSVPSPRLVVLLPLVLPLAFFLVPQLFRSRWFRRLLFHLRLAVC